MAERLDPERLVAIGLSRYEACAYLAMVGGDHATAVEVAERASVPRQRIYDVLVALCSKGLIEIREGRPARYSVKPPAIALPAMLEARLRTQAAENERVGRLIQQLVPDLEAAGDGSAGILVRALRASQESIGGF